MSAPISFRSALAQGALSLFLLTGCGRGVTRAVSPGPGGGLPPQAVIVSPDPNSVFTHVQQAPVTIRWTGEDPDGVVREYRYRLFGRVNPDFPNITDFISFLDENRDSVLRFYAPDFDGWERWRVLLGSPRVTYSTLVPNEVYAFVVVAIDDRGGHDAGLSRDRNILRFAVSPPPGPGIAFYGPHGEVPVGGDDRYASLVVTAGEPVTIHWSATPLAGWVLEGYRWALDDNWPLDDQPSLDDTTAAISPPTSGDVRTLYVETHYDQGRTLHVLLLSFTGIPLATSGPALAWGAGLASTAGAP